MTAKIASHSGWYRGKWETDICLCGEKMRVPQGKKGQYQCNNCKDKAWESCSLIKKNKLKLGE